MRWACFVIVALAWVLPARARARDVSVAIDGCANLVEPLAAALHLELGPGWRVVPYASAGLHLHVRLTACEATEWTVSLTDTEGALMEPEEIAMGSSLEHSHVRIAALWAAERLLRVDPRSAQELSMPGPNTPGPSTTLHGESVEEPEADAEPEAAPTHRFPLLELWLGAGGAYLEDPERLSIASAFLRAAAQTRLTQWFVLGAAIEGGVLFETLNHQQPFARLCAEPTLVGGLGDRVELSVGGRICLSASRHLRGIHDRWTSGVALGGLVRASVHVVDAYAIGVRFDALAWERDVFVDLPGEGSFLGPGLPWTGEFALSLELRYH